MAIGCPGNQVIAPWRLESKLCSSCLQGDGPESRPVSAGGIEHFETLDGVHVSLALIKVPNAPRANSYEHH